MSASRRLGILLSAFSLWVFVKKTVDLVSMGRFPVDIFSLVYAVFFSLLLVSVVRDSALWRVVQVVLVGVASLVCFFFADDKAVGFGVIIAVFAVMMSFSYGFYKWLALLKLVLTVMFILLPLFLALLRGDPLQISRAISWSIFTIVFILGWWFVLENELRERIQEALNLARRVLRAWFTSDRGN